MTVDHYSHTHVNMMLPVYIVHIQQNINYYNGYVLLGMRTRGVIYLTTAIMGEIDYLIMPFLMLAFPTTNAVNTGID